jgi:pimeloyl-ACP methyl ester carboxylesterase
MNAVQETVKLEIKRPAGDALLEGNLVVPQGAVGVILFAHGSGSSRHSPRNSAVAAAFLKAALGALRFDLLSSEEEAMDARTTLLRFDIALLATRLICAVDWIGTRAETKGLPICLFGASTGASAALVAAARRPSVVQVVVSRGGRPDVAEGSLPSVKAPTLLIVGERDTEVLALNRHAQKTSRCENKLEIVPGATHLFEEPGALDKVAQLARDWFLQKLRQNQSHPSH